LFKICNSDRDPAPRPAFFLFKAPDVPAAEKPMKKFVSIIIPTYNRGGYLPQAIASVLNQRHPYLELIVVDDGSNDDTADVVQAFKAGSVVPVRYMYQENSGPASARNLGMAAASFDHIAFLDSDDWFHKDKIALQLSAMEKKSAFLISHTQEIWYRRGSHLNQKKKHRKDEGDIFKRCLELCAVGMSTVMMHKSLIEAVGWFDQEMPCCEDYDYWLRTSVRFPFLLIDEPLTCKNGGRPDQVSSIHRTGIDKFRIKAIEKILNMTILTDRQYRLAFDELEKKCSLYGNGCKKHGRDEEGEYYLALPNRFRPEE
jgi:glycosyltransferase involved in cell wall biosynthesis